MRARNRKQKANKKPPVTRQTVQKRIASLAKGGKLRAAIRLARGWSFEEEGDLAERLIARWQLMAPANREPTFFKQYGAQVLEQLSKDTATLVGCAILSGDASFFRRMARRIETEPPAPKVDEMRRAVLLDKLQSQWQGKEERGAKEIAQDVLGAANTITKADEVRRFRREIQKDK